MKNAVKNTAGSLAVWHILAIVTIVFWGTSFVSTKVLINHGFSSVQIFFVRFVFTYLILLAASHKKFRSDNLKDELKFLLGGLTGGTLYFFTENTALALSQSSNVSLIVCTNPLLIMLAGVFLFKKKTLNKRQVAGSLITFAGMVLVVLNGKFILKISPAGDLLAIGAALAWCVYAYSTEKIRDKYGTFFSIRKIFFYAALTSSPLMLWDAFFAGGHGNAIPWEAFKEATVIGNFLCLGIFASLFGYLVWNKVMEKLGTVLASNYIFAIPLVTMITAALTIGERISAVAILGAASIIAGMIMAEKK